MHSSQLHILLIYVATALTPGPVQNLTAVVDTCKPSVILNWEPPANAAGYVTNYEIRIQDNDIGFQWVEVVNGSTTTIIIGLRLLSTYTFTVGAYSFGNASQKWWTVSRFIGIYIRLVTINFHPCIVTNVHFNQVATTLPTCTQALFESTSHVMTMLFKSGVQWWAEGRQKYILQHTTSPPG